MVVDTRIDGRIEVAEQLGDRLDGLIMYAGRRIQLLGGGQVAFFHRVGERLGLGRQLSDLLGDVDLVVRHRAYQVQRRCGGEGAARGERVINNDSARVDFFMGRFPL